MALGLWFVEAFALICKYKSPLVQLNFLLQLRLRQPGMMASIATPCGQVPNACKKTLISWERVTMVAWKHIELHMNDNG